MRCEYHLRVSYDPPPFPGFREMAWSVTDDNGEGEVIAHGCSLMFALAEAVDTLGIEPRSINRTPAGVYIVKGIGNE